MQEEARIKYGLTSEQIKEVDEQLEELAASNLAAAGGTSEEDLKLLAADPATLSKEDKVAVLKLLHARLEKMQGALTQHAQQAAKAADAAKQPARPSNSNQENDTANEVAAPVAAGGAAVPLGTKPPRSGKRKSAGSDAPAAATKAGSGRGNGRRKKASASASEDSDEEMEEAAAAAAAEGAALDADVEQLMSMGFEERQVRDALEEANGDVQAAVDWLMEHCF